MCSSGSVVGGKLRRNWLTQIHLENGGGYANSDNVVIILLFLQSYLNTSQMSAVSCITNAVLQPYASSKICLLQGPPGTGKSLTAVSLIKNILAQVLICSEQCFFCKKNIFRYRNPVAINVKTGMFPFGILANHKIKVCHNSMKKITIQKITQNNWNF